MKTALILCPDDSQAAAVSHVCHERGMEVRIVSSVVDGIRLKEETKFDVLFISTDGDLSEHVFAERIEVGWIPTLIVVSGAVTWERSTLANCWSKVVVIEGGFSEGATAHALDRIRTAEKKRERISYPLTLSATEYAPKGARNGLGLLRWIGVFPGALLSALLVAFPVHWVVMLIQLTDTPEESFITIGGKGLLAAIPPETLERLGYAFFVPFTFISIGAAIAPRFKFFTASVLGTLVIVFLAYAHLVVAKNGLFFEGGTLKFVLTRVLWGAAIVCGLYKARIAERASSGADR